VGIRGYDIYYDACYCFSDDKHLLGAIEGFSGVEGVLRL